MQIFSIRDLQDRTEELSREAEQGRFAYSDFIKYLGELKILVMNYDAGDLELELETFSN
jgi:hypothetical protein